MVNSSYKKNVQLYFTTLIFFLILSFLNHFPYQNNKSLFFSVFFSPTIPKIILNISHFTDEVGQISCSFSSEAVYWLAKQTKLLLFFNRHKAFFGFDL